MRLLSFDEIVPGTHLVTSGFTIDRNEMLAFARRWDPLPQHIDDAAQPGGITAPGIFLLAIKMALIHRLSQLPAVIASMGYEEVRFLRPAQAGDDIVLEFEWLEKRLSASRPGCGVVRHRSTLTNQRREIVMTQIETLLVHLLTPARPAG